MRLHEPGQCPVDYYGDDCNGVGIYGPDPFAEEIYGDSRDLWLCRGQIELSLDEI